MLSFRQYLTEAKNLHASHMEELIFNEGVDGTRKAIFFLRDLRDMLAGHNPNAINLSVKIDGAPAIFAGEHPETGEFFVAKKSLFNKTPKYYTTQKQISNDLSGELKDKFSIALQEFSKLGIKGIYQGDLLFTNSDLKKETINGEKYITFHPNTIVYAIPENSKLGKEVSRARIGIAWHTVYKGKDIQSLNASPGRNILSKMKKTSKVFNIDLDYRDVSGTATFTEKETTEITNLLSEIGSLFRTIPSSIFKDITNNTELRDRIKIFNNTKIRANQRITNPAKHVRDLMSYLENYWDGEIDSKKTEPTKEKYRKQKEDMMAWFTAKNRVELGNIFQLMMLMTEAKQIIINKLNQASKTKTFLKTNNGFQSTTEEGFVAVDHMTGNIIKFVDRMEFSRANFSPEILKGWN